MRMKKLFTFMAAMLTACMAFAQADQTFQFVDKDGNVVADGSTIVVSELNEEGMMVVPLFVKNMSGEKAAVSMYETIDAMPNGQWQTCAFGNCMLLTETGYSSKSIVGDDFDAGIETEWIPVAGQYATWTATLQIHVFNIMTQTKFGVTTEVAGNNVIGHGPKVNVRFEYKNPSATQEVYTVYSPDGTLTFYYDDQKLNRQGKVFDLSFTKGFYQNYNHYGWEDYLYENEEGAPISKMIVDPSMSHCRPTSMSGWFAGSNVTSIVGLEYLNTSDATDMSGMFFSTLVESLDLSHFNTSKVTNMAEMFGCYKLKSLDLSSFDTGNVINMNGMFAGCESLTSLDVSHLNTQNVTDMSSMFCGVRVATLDLSNFNTSKVDNMSGMFSSCGSTSIILSNFDTREVRNMESMFNHCTNLRSLDLSSFETGKVFSMELMFYKDENLQTLDISKFDTQNVYNMKMMFDGCSNLESLDVSHFNTQNVTSMEQMFNQCRSLKTLDVTHFDTRNVENMGWMFNECSSLESLDVSHFNTSSNTYFKGMFADCGKLKEIDVSHFDTSKATSEMTAMFMNCRSLESLDLSKFYTGNVTFMINMFMNCSSLKTLDLSSFETAKVVAFHGMFSGCSNLETVDLTNFTSEQSTSMFNMFQNCSNLTKIYCDHDWAEGKTFSEGELGYNMANIFTNCSKLVGGNGTAYDELHTNIYYAHPDVAGNPGYFTSKTSGIATTTVSQTAEASRFSLDGRPLSDSHKGINLIRKSDGSVRKVMVK